MEINDPSNGTKSEAYNIQMVTTSKSTNDTVIGDDGDNYIWSNGGRDIFYGGSGEDWFAVGGEKEDGKLPINLTIKDYEQNELISLFDFGITQSYLNAISIGYDNALNQSIIGIDMPDYKNEDLIRIDGVWGFNEQSFELLESDDEFSFTLTSPYSIENPKIEGSSESDSLAAFGKPREYNAETKFVTQKLEIRGYEGADGIAGGAGNDILDGGEEATLNKYGRDVGQDGKVVIDGLYYIDAPNGIDADFEAGIVYDDGFGSQDTVVNFERVHGSYHDDTVQLSHDIYRGYNPLYGNDKITGPSSLDIVNNSYLGYWDLENATSGFEQQADSSVTEAHIIFNFDAGTVDKFITGGDYDIKPTEEADYTDTFSGSIEGVVGSRGSDIIYGHSTEGKSTILDGERTWYYGWLNAYHGDDKIIALGTGDDKLQGGGGDDLLIAASDSGTDIIYGHGTSTTWPNYIDTDNDTFVVGGSSKVYLVDYELGEDLILLDYDISGVDDFVTAYDFTTDYTSLTIFDGDEKIEDRVLIRGNVKVSSIEKKTTFTDDALKGSSNPSINNDVLDTKVILDKSTDISAEIVEGGEGDDIIYGKLGLQYIRTGGGDDKVSSGAGDDVVVQGQGDVEVDTGVGDDRVSS